LFQKIAVIMVLIVGVLLALYSPLAAESSPEVYVSIYPIYEIAERIGGERLEIHQVVPDGVEPHGYEPVPRDVAGLEGAAAFVYVGLGLEAWGERGARIVAEQGGRVIKLSDHVELREYRGHHHDNQEEDSHDQHNGGDGYSQHINEDEHDTHEKDSHQDHNEDSPDHHHGEYDNHIWLDFENMKITAEILTDLFIDLEPEGEEEFVAARDEVQHKLAELDAAYREGLEDLKHDTIIVSHAAFGYLADSYGLKQIAVTGISPEEEPSSRVIADLIEVARTSGVNYIFLETLASPRTVEVIAEEAGLEILTLNPVEGLRAEDREQGRDYFSIMYSNLENLKQALGKNR